MTTEKFDFDSLTLEEVETIESITGVSIEQIMDEGQLRGKTLKVICWIVMKRKDPAFTIEQAAKFTFKQALDLFGGVEDDPKE